MTWIFLAESHQCKPPVWGKYGTDTDVLKGSVWECKCGTRFTCTRSGNYVKGFKRPRWKRVKESE